MQYPGFEGLSGISVVNGEGGKVTFSVVVKRTANMTNLDDAKEMAKKSVLRMLHRYVGDDRPDDRRMTFDFHSDHVVVLGEVTKTSENPRNFVV